MTQLQDLWEDHRIGVGVGAATGLVGSFLFRQPVATSLFGGAILGGVGSVVREQLEKRGRDRRRAPDGTPFTQLTDEQAAVIRDELVEENEALLTAPLP